ncbi:uncharacterized protein LOC110994527 [Pieris rapae]|uniref:uncharacterized protein LOC110994527 n=1 Tax=Pieris rapae TaxID=64459 RepID=UPI001E27C03F|nr:uncharacterized protein LOC110994527 [Pieris rapae]
MCYICGCFAWSLDLIQRILTFFLSCWLMVAVCCGLMIAVLAGVAYGYNYCIAEFVTLTQADVRVYMRRGQFYDQPDLKSTNNRRMGDSENISYNLTSDYQDYVNKDEPLSQKWSKGQDNRIYAEKLTKYSESRRKEPVNKEMLYYKFTTAPTRRISITPNPIFSTTIWHSGSSEIIMRQFEPINDINSKSEENSSNEDIETTQSISPDIKIIVEDSPKSNEQKMRDWKPSPRPVVHDYLTEVDEDSIVYKAV